MLVRISVVGSVFAVCWLGAFAAVRVWFVSVRAAATSSAQLTVETVPTGAMLVIDDQPQVTTPATLTLRPGVHRVLVRGKRAERTARVTLTAGAAMTQYFDLGAASADSASPGQLSIVTEPPGARVVVDGRARGISPLVLDDLTAGAHDVTVSSNTGSAHRSITVDNGSFKEMVFSMPSASAPVAGWLAVTSPFPVDVIEGPDVVAKSGTAKTMMAAGWHNVVIRSDAIGYESHQRINVVAGRVAQLNVVPPAAPLNVNASPWADVFIDGVSVGQTPLGNLMVPIGTHQVTFRHPELGERRQTIVVSAKGANRVAVDFAK